MRADVNGSCLEMSKERSPSENGCDITGQRKAVNSQKVEGGLRNFPELTINVNVQQEELIASGRPVYRTKSKILEDPVQE